MRHGAPTSARISVMARALMVANLGAVDYQAALGLQQSMIAAQQRTGFTGVWVDGRKIASIGVGIRRWVTYHGFALNVCCDLNYFDGIVPCGIEGCAMTSIAELGRTDIAVADFARIMASSF